MVSLRFKSEKVRYRAWMEAGRNRKISDMDVLRKASWSGKSVHFPTVRAGSKKHKELLKIFKEVR